MANFYLYVDESGKYPNSDYVSLCGFLTHIGHWQQISFDWNSLRLAWDAPPIHMADVMHPERDKSGLWLSVKQRFGEVWERQRDEMLKQFAGIILNSFAACVGCSVDAKHFGQMPDSKFKHDMQNPLYMAFHTVVMNCIEMVGRLTDEQSISIILDDDQEYSINCYRVLNQLRATFPDKVGKKIDCICFGNDKAYPGIQAADMLAYETRSLLIQRIANPEVEPSTLYVALTRKLVHQPKLYTPFFLDKINTEYGQEKGGS